jgi:hypothetical protein
MKRNFRRYAEISKVEDQEDGTIKVWGYASSEAEDSDGETISADAMKAALPDYLKFGAVREMHQPIAAGTAIEANVEKDGKTFFGAHVVDPLAITKVKTKVYKGFSIGGKVTGRDSVNKNMITGLKLIEVSLVDRPANPEAVFTMYKAEFGEIEKLSDQDAIDALADVLDEKALTPQQLLKAARDAIAKTTSPEPPAAAADPAVSAPVVVTPAAPVAKVEGETLKKGVSQMCQFASLLQSLTWLASDAAYEAAYEQDGSTVPAQLRDWLKGGVTIFAAMSAEEIAELLASIRPVTVTITAAAEATDLTKAGAKFSKATKAALLKIHGAMKEACAHLDGMGYQADDDGDMEAAAVAEITKVADADPPVADPVQTPEPAIAEPVQKADEIFKAELAKRDAVIEALTKRLEKVEQQPLPGKAFLRAIAKGEDLVPDTDSKTAAEELPANATPEQRAHAEFKKVFQNGGVRLVPR